MNELQKAAVTSLAKPSSTARTAGKSLAVAGVGGIGLVLLAGLIPFVGVLGLSIVMTLFGLGLIVLG